MNRLQENMQMTDERHFTCVGIITARGGSKGLPRKNILPIAGKPLIAWSIDQALNSKEITRVIVSTDDEEIAEVARFYGADVPFIRPNELSQDKTPHIDVIEHALCWLRENEKNIPDYIFTIQPTSPLRSVTDIDTMISMAYMNDVDAVVSVTETHIHPYLVRKMTNSRLLKPFIETTIPYLRRQDLPPAFFINGAGFVNKVSSLCDERTFYPEKTMGYVMPMERSFQIDDRLDFDIIEFLLTRKYSNM